MPQTMSTRWCPTPQQLMILEDMYRAGIRTPKASQIQQITAHLSFYGKIEGKNVFYWFQNHKARERQKLRKRMMKELQHQYLLDRTRDSAAALHVQPHHYFFHQQRENSRALNFMCKVTAPGVEETRNPAAIVDGDGNRSSGRIHEWVMLEQSPPSRCRPLETLELFPVTSTGLKEDKTAANSPTSTTTECSSSKTDE